MRTIALTNRKGGSGKTTVAVNLAFRLAQKGKKVLLVDLDTQAHATFILDPEPGCEKKGLEELFLGKQRISSLILPARQKKLMLFPSPGGIEQLADTRRSDLSFFRDCLQEVASDYDFCIIDMPPSLEKVVICGLVAAEEVFIPLQTHFLPMQGLAQLVRLIIDTAAEWGHALQLSGIIPTLYNPRTRIHLGVINEIKSTFGSKLVLPGIPYDIRLAEAPSFRRTVFEHAAKSKAALAFNQLAKKVLEM